MATITRAALGDGFRAGIDVRVSLRADAGSGGSPFDGGWFPRSNDLSVELPELIAELDRRGVRIERFTYALDAWLPLPRKLVLQDRIVRTGGFRSMDPAGCLPDLGRRHEAGRPARRAAGHRRPHRRPCPATGHPPGSAPVAADGAGRGPVDPAPAGARPAPPPRRLILPAANRLDGGGAAPME